MDKEKPFDVVSIVILAIIALLSDGADIVAITAFGIPAIGQVTYIANAIVSAVVWATIQLWFIIKLRTFGKSGVVNLAGGIANVIGFPSTTIITAIAIWLANNETAKSLVSTASVKPIK